MRQPNGHAASLSTRDRAQAFRAAFDLTESQTELLVALVVARVIGQPLGCEAATRRHMTYLGFTMNQLGHLAELERLGLIECVGVTDEDRPNKWLMATDRAFRLFGYTPPRRLIGTFDAVAHAEAMTDRFIGRQRATAAARQLRLRKSA